MTSSSKKPTKRLTFLARDLTLFKDELKKVSYEHLAGDVLEWALPPDKPKQIPQRKELTEHQQKRVIKQRQKELQTRKKAPKMPDVLERLGFWLNDISWHKYRDGLSLKLNRDIYIALLKAGITKVEKRIQNIDADIADVEQEIRLLTKDNDKTAEHGYVPDEISRIALDYYEEWKQEAESEYSIQKKKTAPVPGQEGNVRKKLSIIDNDLNHLFELLSYRIKAYEKAFDFKNTAISPNCEEEIFHVLQDDLNAGIDKVKIGAEKLMRGTGSTGESLRSIQTLAENRIEDWKKGEQISIKRKLRIAVRESEISETQKREKRESDSLIDLELKRIVAKLLCHPLDTEPAITAVNKLRKKRGLSTENSAEHEERVCKNIYDSMEDIELVARLLRVRGDARKAEFIELKLQELSRSNNPRKLCGTKAGIIYKHLKKLYDYLQKESEDMQSNEKATPVEGPLGENAQRRAKKSKEAWEKEIERIKAKEQEKRKEEQEDREVKRQTLDVLKTLVEQAVSAPQPDKVQSETGAAEKGKKRQSRVGQPIKNHVLRVIKAHQPIKSPDIVTEIGKNKVSGNSDAAKATTIRHAVSELRAEGHSIKTTKDGYVMEK